MAALDEIRTAIIEHPSNAWATEAGHLPLYTAAPGSRIVLIGQAPGRKAQESGIPWNDASGRRLRSWLGLTDEQFYDPDVLAILPMDFYYPGKAPSGDLPPRRGFAELWHPRILEQLTDVRLTILVGSYAQRYYLGARARRTLTETVQHYREYLPGMLPIVHPSPLNVGWHLKNQWFESEIVPELRRIVGEGIA